MDPEYSPCPPACDQARIVAVYPALLNLTLTLVISQIVSVELTLRFILPPVYVKMREKNSVDAILFIGIVASLCRPYHRFIKEILELAKFLTVVVSKDSFQKSQLDKHNLPVSLEYRHG